MFWSYVQLDDGTQFAYSETREDGTVRVAVDELCRPEVAAVDARVPTGIEALGEHEPGIRARRTDADACIATA